MRPWYENWLLWLVVAVVICLLLAAGILIHWWRRTAARRYLLGTLRNIADRLLRDVTLPDGVGGHIGVDALLLRDGCLYVLVIRHVDGAIFAGDKMDQWSAVGKGRSMFHNPLHALQDRLIAVRALAPELTVVPRVLFIGSTHFPKGCPENVQLFEEFAQPLRRSKKVAVALDTQLESIWTRLREAAGVPRDAETPAIGSPASNSAAG